MPRWIAVVRIVNQDDPKEIVETEPVFFTDPIPEDDLIEEITQAIKDLCEE